VKKMSDQKKDCFEQICVWQGVPLGSPQGLRRID